METIKDLYAIPNYTCNLNCPHCTLSKISEKYNEKSFIDTLKNINAEQITLFGGEPLLYKETFKKIVKTNKITSISTNLLLLDDEIIQYLKTYNISIATSWNKTRFTKAQYNTWIANLKTLENNNLDCIILVTLTEDLISLNLNNFLSILKDLNQIKSITGILFEQLVDNSKNKVFYEKVDEWLYNITKYWQFSFKNLILDKIKHWNCDCTKTYTLTPNGTLRKGCPQYTLQYLRNECLTCKLANICRPCILQKECTFPKKLYNAISK